MGEMILTYTKTIKASVFNLNNQEIKGHLKAMAEQGYTLIGAEDEKRGGYVGNCENCGLPIFEKDKYNLDTEGVYWHEECPEAENE
ncbi:hypothetical protein [Maridesulfovibrio sp.]|uniref:hypothetical protein n=1 Tax=Maridesulfovibrio sp. TaxID=2795000 RepID=UPI0029CA2BFB|nr:hypothetical protein [Maridesulfovibrio sp.]